MNGGLLIQNCNHHTIRYTHEIYEFKTDRGYQITSTHHQMQYPFNLKKDDYSLLMISHNTNSDFYEGDQIKNVPYEPEVVLYHVKGNPKCLAIQGHPEMMRSESPIISRLNEIINDLVNEN